MQFDKKSLKILHCISLHAPIDAIGLDIYLSLDLDDIEECIDYLLSNELIEIDTSDKKLSGAKTFQITKMGKIILENELKFRRNFTFTEFRAWVTLLIAVIALVLSIISLYLQYQ